MVAVGKSNDNWIGGVRNLRVKQETNKLKIIYCDWLVIAASATAVPLIYTLSRLSLPLFFSYTFWSKQTPQSKSKSSFQRHKIKKMRL